MPFEKEAFLLTILIVMGNAFVAVLLNVPSFGVTQSANAYQSQQYFLTIAPPDFRFWDSNASFSQPNQDITGGDNSFSSTDPNAILNTISFLVNLPGLLFKVVQLLIFMVVGYVFLLQLALLPGWLIFLVFLFVSAIQAWGLFYISTYVFSALRGRIS